MRFSAHIPHTHCILLHTGSTDLNTSAPHSTALEHYEMNTNDAYGTNTAEITTTGNVAIRAAETDDYYDYVI